VFIILSFSSFWQMANSKWQVASSKKDPLTQTLRLRRTGLSATETLADLRRKGRGRKKHPLTLSLSRKGERE